MAWLTGEELQIELAHWLSAWPDGFITLGAKNQIIWISPLVSQLLGWRKNDVIDQHPHDLLCVDSRLHQHAKQDCPFTIGKHDNTIISSVWRNKNGFNIAVDFRLVPVKTGGSTHAVVTFRTTENDEHDRAELEKLSAYVDNNPSPIAEFDAEGQLLFGNPALQERLLDYGFDDEGKACVFPDDLPLICQQVANKVESNVTVEVAIGNECYSWRFDLLELDSESKSTPSVMAYGIDITKQKQAEKQASEERANARRDFYAKMMHELRTPLNAIVGFSELLLARSKSKLDKRDLKSLDTIKMAGLQLSDLITDTLDIAKIEAGKMTLNIKDFDARSVADDIHHQMLSLAEAKQLRYETQIDAISPMRSDRTKLRQLLVNLISNAIKYTQKGAVYLTLNEILHRGQACLQVKVKDTGVGIPEDQLKDLFAAYERVKRKDEPDIQGTGLGLALVQEIVAMMGGEIFVTSQEGQGSCFTIILPLSVE